MEQLSSRRREEEPSSRLFLIAAILLICFGTAVRIRQYAERTSFWRDEAFVVLNVRQLPVAKLAGRLQWDQAAPPMFLWALRGIRGIAGENELSLRSISLISALLALIAFAVLARKILPWPGAFLAIGLLSLDHRLLDYSAQVKQYSGDAFVSTLILLAAVSAPELPPHRRLAQTTIVSALAVWFSYPAVIVFMGTSFVLTLKCFRTGSSAAVKAMALNALFLVSFMLLYLFVIHRQHTDFLYWYWQDSFPDWRHPQSVPGWLAKKGFDFLQSPYRWAGPLLGLLVMMSLGWAARRRRWENWGMCAAPIAALLIAVAAGQYPFDGGGRLTLFLVPQLYLLCGAGVGFLREIASGGWRILWWAPVGTVLGFGIATSTNRLIQPVYQSHIRPAVEYVKANRLPGEALVLAGVPPIQDPSNGFDGRNLEALCYWAQPPPPLYVSLNSLDQITQRRYWVLAAFPPGGVARLDPLLRQLRAFAVQRRSFIDQKGGAAYLFERASSETR